MSAEDERTAPEITLSRGMSPSPRPVEGPVDEVAVDLGEDTAARGLLDSWSTGGHTGEEATASGRTEEVVEDGAPPTDVRLLGELLGFAGPDPEARARRLEQEAAREEDLPSPARRRWLAEREVLPVPVLVAVPDESCPSATAPVAEPEREREPAPDVAPQPPALPQSRLGLGVAIGVVLGLLAGLGAIGLLEAVR